MRSKAIVLPVLALLSAAPLTATHAQLVNPFPYSSAGRGLSKSDIAMVIAVSNRINAAEPAPTSPESWTNPATGNSGTVTFVRKFQSAGMPCNTLRYRFSFRHPPRRSTYVAGWCQTPDGEWKIKS